MLLSLQTCCRQSQQHCAVQRAGALALHTQGEHSAQHCRTDCPFSVKTPAVQEAPAVTLQQAAIRTVRVLKRGQARVLLRRPRSSRRQRHRRVAYAPSAPVRRHLGNCSCSGQAAGGACCGAQPRACHGLRQAALRVVWCRRACKLLAQCQSLRATHGHTAGVWRVCAHALTHQSSSFLLNLLTSSFT